MSLSRLLTIPSGRTAKWVVAAVFLLVSIPIAALSGKFEQAQKNESSSFLPGKAESIKALKAIERYPGGELAPAVIVFERRGGLTAADKRRIEGTVAQLDANRPKLVLAAQPPVYAQNGAAAIVVQPVQPGDGQGEAFQNAAQHVRDIAEGLAIGNAARAGALTLALSLVIGFGLHNATEGFGIAAPLAGHPVGWGFLAVMGLIAGGPTAPRHAAGRALRLRAAVGPVPGPGRRIDPLRRRGAAGRRPQTRRAHLGGLGPHRWPPRRLHYRVRPGQRRRLNRYGSGLPTIRPLGRSSAPTAHGG